MASTMTNTDNVGGAHTTIVSIGVILIVTIILIELAGTNHMVAIGIGFLFVAVLFIAGMNHQVSLAAVAKYPQAP